MLEKLRAACERRYVPLGIVVEDGTAHSPSIRLSIDAIVVCEITGNDAQIAVHMIGILGSFANRPRTFTTIAAALAFVDEVTPHVEDQGE